MRLYHSLNFNLMEKHRRYYIEYPAVSTTDRDRDQNKLQQRR